MRRRLALTALVLGGLDRQPIKRPAYQGHVTEAELGELLASIRWVRQHPY